MPSPPAPTVLVWLRRDLRLADNAALAAAARAGRVLPVFVWAPEEEEPWPPGAASRWWLHHSLAALRESLARRGLPLVLRRAASSGEALDGLLRETGARALYFNRLYEPAAFARDTNLARRLEADGIEVRTFSGELLFEPWQISTASGGPYRVFTPFHKACLAEGGIPAPAPAPRGLRAPEAPPSGLELEQLGLLPTIDWAAGLRAAWTPGEAGARRRLERFARDKAAHYQDGRDRPDLEGVSRLSPHLHFGEVSPAQVWQAIGQAQAGAGGEAFLRQLVWREFARHLLHHYPHTDLQPLNPRFADFPWHQDPEALAAWQRGRSGFPYIDAAMRQLWDSGWMHNRARMAVASFLTKDLLIPWQEGARWFWDTLVDADLANNSLGWQWTAGCGADAAPYFRVFNPLTQGRRFDPHGDYVRRWLPERATLAGKKAHDPGHKPDHDYPAPLLDHAQARRRALAAYEQIKRSSKA